MQRMLIELVQSPNTGEKLSRTVYIGDEKMMPNTLTDEYRVNGVDKGAFFNQFGIHPNDVHNLWETHMCNLTGLWMRTYWTENGATTHSSGVHGPEITKWLHKYIEESGYTTPFLLVIHWDRADYEALDYPFEEILSIYHIEPDPDSEWGTLTGTLQWKWRGYGKEVFLSSFGLPAWADWKMLSEESEMNIVITKWLKAQPKELKVTDTVSYP